MCRGTLRNLFFGNMPCPAAMQVRCTLTAAGQLISKGLSPHTARALKERFLRRKVRFPEAVKVAVGIGGNGLVSVLQEEVGGRFSIRTEGNSLAAVPGQ